MTRRVIVWIGLLVFASPMTWPSVNWAVEPAATDVLAEFSIRKDAPLLTVPVVIRGRTYRFVLDTGASLMVYDKSFEAQLDSPRRKAISSVTASDPVTVDCYDAPDAMLGPLSLCTEEQVACTDLGGLARAGVGRIDDIIGMTFLRKYALTLDLPHRKIQFRGIVSFGQILG